MPVHVAAEGNASRAISTAFIAKTARRMLDALQLKKAELSILLTSDDQIKNLNRDYRHKDRATDVLAFAMREGAHADLAGEMLGDVVISLETATRQAGAQGHTLREEVVFLLGHGLLHLLGWDHDTKPKDRAMRRETERLCAAAGVPAPARPGIPTRESSRDARRARTNEPKPRPAATKTKESPARGGAKSRAKSTERPRRKSE